MAKLPFALGSASCQLIRNRFCPSIGGSGVDPIPTASPNILRLWPASRAAQQRYPCGEINAAERCPNPVLSVGLLEGGCAFLHSIQAPAQVNESPLATNHWNHPSCCSSQSLGSWPFRAAWPKESGRNGGSRPCGWGLEQNACSEKVVNSSWGWESTTSMSEKRTSR